MEDRGILILLVFLAMLSFFINVGSYGVLETSDARYAEIAREMYHSHDYLHPNFLGIHHYHKPPYTYWITALGYKIFGINPFGARFFLQIAVILQMLLVYKLYRLLFGSKKGAFWAMLIYFSFPMVLSSSRTLTTDPFLTVFVLASLVFWLIYKKRGAIFYFYLFTLSLAFGMLTKGPLIFIIPITFIIPYLIIEKKEGRAKLSINHLAAWLLFLIVGLSWYLYLVAENSAFFGYFIGRQTIDRFSKNVFNRNEPFWYFLVFSPLMAMPWIIVLPKLLKEVKIKIISEYLPIILAILIPLLFFTLSSSKRILYVLPFYGLLAVFIANLYEKAKVTSKFVSRVIFAYSFIFILIFIVLPFVKTEFFMPKYISFISLVFLFVMLILLKKISTRDQPIIIGTLFSLFLLIISTFLISKNQIRSNGLQPIAKFIREKGLKEREILVYNKLLPSLAFELNKMTISLYNGSKKLKRETQFEENNDWEKYLINLKTDRGESSLKDILKKPTVLIVYKHRLPKKLGWLYKKYLHKKRIYKWFIYY